MVNIFCGKESSFCINSKGSVYAWGLNNYGQLGIGHQLNTCTPTLINELEGINITSIAGGEHHTLACASDGKVYAWGRNDEG